MQMVVTVSKISRFPSVGFERVIVKHSVSSTSLLSTMATSKDAIVSVAKKATLAGIV